jgi:hypothetical protein
MKDLVSNTAKLHPFNLRALVFQAVVSLRVTLLFISHDKKNSRHYSEGKRAECKNGTSDTNTLSTGTLASEVQF